MERDSWMDDRESWAGSGDAGSGSKRTKKEELNEKKRKMKEQKRWEKYRRTADKTMSTVELLYFSPSHGVDDPAIINVPHGTEHVRTDLILDTGSLDAAHDVVLEMKVSATCAPRVYARRRRNAHLRVHLLSAPSCVPKTRWTDESEVSFPSNSRISACVRVCLVCAPTHRVRSVGLCFKALRTERAHPRVLLLTWAIRTESPYHVFCGESLGRTRSSLPASQRPSSPSVSSVRMAT